VTGARIDREERKGKGASDHAPAVVTAPWSSSGRRDQAPAPTIPFGSRTYLRAAPWSNST
jgi:hypothetical protein